MKRSRPLLLAVRHLILLVTLCFPVLIACSSGQSEAQREVQRLIDSVSLRCGDTYYYWYWHPSDPRLTQVVGLRITVTSLRLSKADVANGLAFAGEIVAECDMFRYWLPDSAQPFDWQDCGFGRLTGYLPIATSGWVEKRDGQWSVAPLPGIKVPDFACDTAPR